MENKYNVINDGEKIKFVSLKTPNPIGEDVISFISELPQEFGLHKYLDYDEMFEKGFIAPLKNPRRGRMAQRRSTHWTTSSVDVKLTTITYQHGLS